MCPPFHVTPEHQARELLNLVLLLERCLRLLKATDEERAEWQAELESAHQRLEELLASPLQATFSISAATADAAGR